MDISLFVINTIICAIFWLLSRFCCTWIGRLSEASAGQTLRDVEAHISQGPGEKLFPWLMDISPRPLPRLVVSVLPPLGGILFDILPNPQIIFLVANDMVIIAALPQPLPHNTSYLVPSTGGQ